MESLKLSRGALLGGAIGASSAVVMAAGVYGVRRLIARQQGVAKLRAQGVKDVKADPLVKTDEELTEWTKKYNGELYDDASSPKMELSKEEFIKNQGREAWVETSTNGRKITISRAATRSYIKLYMTTSHELMHSYYFQFTDYPNELQEQLITKWEIQKISEYMSSGQYDDIFDSTFRNAYKNYMDYLNLCR
jgi:hypothetical protein